MAKEAATQTQEFTLMEKFLDLPLTITDHIRAVAIVVLFMNVCFRNKKYWITADFFSCSLATIGLFLFPRALIGYQVKEGMALNALHVAMIQVWGALFAGLSVSTYLTRNSKDGIVQLAHFITRIIGLLVMILMTILHYYSENSPFNLQTLTFNLLFFVCYLISTVYHMTTYSPAGVYIRVPEIRGWLNGGLLSDALHSIIVALVHYSHTPLILGSFVLKDISVDHLHFALSHIMSGLCVGFAFQSVLALFFTNVADKRAMLKARLVTMILSQVFAFYPMLYHHSTESFNDLLGKQFPMLAILILYSFIIVKTKNEE